MVNGDGAHEHTEEAESKQDGNGEADGGEDSNEQEVIVIQDTGFTVKIQAPGTEPFDLQVRISSSQASTHNSSMCEDSLYLLRDSFLLELLCMLLVKLCCNNR